jgi:urocanate hydratase
MISLKFFKEKGSTTIKYFANILSHDYHQGKINTFKYNKAL